MTKTDEPLVIERPRGRDRAYREVEAALVRSHSPEQFAHEIGVKGLTWLIRAVLDDHYPEDVFPQDRVQYGVNWASEHGGEDIDPGVKWIALLRMAIAEVSDAE